MAQIPFAKMVLAFLFSRDTSQLTGLFGGLLMLGGVWLHWCASSHVSDVEEDEKNEKITAEKARRRIRFIAWRAVALICLGAVLLVVAVFGSTE